MNLPQTIGQEAPPLLFQETVCPVYLPRLWYLWPSRYFHFYVFFDKTSRLTCWLPEGYSR